ncbi:MAG: AAA family ATPase [Nanoarchaeota archaeon]|nr:AAA family ATPase [Nanoarchaeota archaeon]
MIIVKRKESQFIGNSNKWILLYGRRKTGKTFLVKNFIKFDKYFFIKRDRTIINEKTMSYETFIEILKESLNNNKTVVIDEFHRLGDSFLDILHSIGRGGKLILLSSTLYLSKTILSTKSPLLGLVSEVPLGLIPLDSCFKEIYKLGFSKKEAMELSIFCREPIVLDYIKKGKKAREILAEMMLTIKHTVPALLGEIFIEEERQISNTYEGILRAISTGKHRAGEITNYLFSKRLIKKESSSMLQQYLKNLIDLGVLKRVMLFNKRDYFYDLISPLMKLYFYADEKYNFSEESTQKKAEMIISELIPKLVESSVREFLSYKYGLREAIISEKDREIDICLLKFKKPALVGEVKWGEINKKDIMALEKKLEGFKDSFIFVPDKTKTSKKGFKDMLDFC